MTKIKHACDHLPKGIYRPPHKEEYLNYSNRTSEIDSIVVHYTVADYAVSYYLLAHGDGKRPNVSVHYMIAPDGRMDDLVDDKQKAWHAGVSYWRGKEGINDNSVGIELVNPGSGSANCYPVADAHPAPPEECVRHPFPKEQMETLISLLFCLKDEHKGIKEANIIGHMDIAPSRKDDPGIEFPWYYLYQKGIGIYSDKILDTPETLLKFKDNSDEVLELKLNLSKLGYLIEDSSRYFGKELAYVVRAFHMHFNQDIEDQGAGWGDWNSIDQVRLDELLHMQHEVVYS